MTRGVARTRFRFGYDLAEALTFRVGAAARLSSDQTNLRFVLDHQTPSTSGLAWGQATLDEASFEVRPRAGWALRAGRFQNGSGLPGTISKSLDRNDSPSFGVTWTDGIRVSHRASSGWSSTLTLQQHPREGRVGGIYSPLDVTRTGATRGVFATTGRRWDGDGPAEVLFGLTLLPSALPRASEGNPDASPERYAALTARGALRLPAGGGGRHLLVGGAAGWAPSTQLLPDGSEADGGALQLGASAIGSDGRHRAGLLLTRLSEGWLISSDFRPDNLEVEARYRWTPAPGRNAEIRVRERRGVLDPALGGRRGRDRDLFVRFTLQVGS